MFKYIIGKILFTPFTDNYSSNILNLLYTVFFFPPWSQMWDYCAVRPL
jgi:hypothetical protein